MSLKPSLPVKKHNVRPVALAREAWGFVKARRYLWWIGLLAGLGQGYGMNPQVISRFDERLNPASLSQRLDTATTPVTMLLLIILLFLLLVWIFSVIAEAGLIRAVQESRLVTFRATLGAGRAALWPLIKLNVFVAVVSILLAFLVGFPILAAAASSSGPRLLVGGIGALFMLLYGLLLALLYPWMTRYVVLEKLRTLAAIGSAWRLFRRAARELILIGLGGLLLQVICSIAILATIAVAFVPLAFLTAWVVKGTAALTVIGVLLIGVLCVGVILAGVLTAVKSAYYTLAFGRLHGGA